MIRISLNIIFCFLSFLAFSQKKSNAVKNEWKKQHQEVQYDKDGEYQGPRPNGYHEPVDFNTPSSSSGSGSAQNYNYTPYQGKSYSGKQIQQGKIIPQNYNSGKKNGTLKKDKNVVPPEPIDMPDEGFSNEEKQQNYRGGSTSSSSSSSSSSSGDSDGSVWKWIGIIILIALAVFIIYLIVSNIKPGEKTIPFVPLEENLNPETISKTELELRLEEAENEENFKECVRIYFLFAMKELITRKQVYWKKEKTNMHYIIEMQGKPGVLPFEKIVSQYDIVWYGDYNIDKSAYYSILPALKDSYKELEQLP